MTGSGVLDIICAQLFNELRDRLITFLLFVRRKRVIDRNDHKLFSSNRGVSHLKEACRINDQSRGSVLGYEILPNNLRSKCTVVAS